MLGASDAHEFLFGLRMGLADPVTTGAKRTECRIQYVLLTRGSI